MTCDAPWVNMSKIRHIDRSRDRGTYRQQKTERAKIHPHIFSEANRRNPCPSLFVVELFLHYCIIALTVRKTTAFTYLTRPPT